MASTLKPRQEKSDETQVRKRILDAAFAVFTTSGYAQASTLEIATRAKVSKRDLYALVGKKQDMLVACVTARAGRLQLPADAPVPQNRDIFADVLTKFGAQLLREVTDPAVVSVFRLAIAEAGRAPEVAQTLDSVGRAASRAALRELLARAQSSRLIDGDPVEMSGQFMALLWGDLMLSLLLGIADRPSERELEQRARKAASAFLRLYPQLD